MNSQFTHAMVQARQQELYRTAEQARLVAELPGRPSRIKRFLSAAPSLRRQQPISGRVAQA